MQEGYSKCEFWEAYARFFFAAEPEQGKISDLADSLAHHLSTRIPYPDQQTNVLCLGVGVASFEYPILSAIERASGRRIIATGIDSAGFPLHVSSMLLTNLQRTFRSSWDFADYIKELWPSCPPPEEDGRFFKFDLDGRGNVPLSPDRPWSGDYPSPWHQQLRERGLVPKDGFDVITAAFCFHHIHWWRPALCNALRLLRPGGLLLLSQVEGDVSFLDWNQPEPWLSNERGGGEFGLVQRMMDAFWQHPELHRHLLKRPQAGAIRPWSQIDLMERLPLKRVPGTEDKVYFAHNRMRPSDVVAIMETRGLSPFRMAMDYLKSERKYRDHLNQISGRFCIDNRPLPTINRICWHSFQSPGVRALNRSTLLRKFTASPTPTSPDAKPPVQLWEYELLEASAVAHETFHGKTIEERAFIDFLRQLILSGTLCNGTPFGVLGQRLVKQEKFSAALCFANPLCPPHSMAELMLYMCLRQAHLRAFSNSNVLLKTILPRFNTPVVFSYVRDVCQNNEAPSVTLVFQRYRSFLEMRFRIALPPDFLSKVGKTQAFKDVIAIVQASLSSSMPETAVSQEYPRKRRASFILPVSVISDASKNLFCNSTQAVADIFRKDFALDWAHQCLTRSRTLCGHFGASEDSPNNETLMEQAFSVEMVETLYWLCLIPQWQETVIFPATYSNPKGEGVSADDSIIFFYSQKLPPSHIRHEYRKVSLMFDQLNMRRLATYGEEVGLYEQLSSLSHELSKQTSVLFNNRLRPLSTMFQVGKLPRTTVPGDKDDWPVPLGTIGVPTQFEEDVASWLVAPNPKLFASLQDYLVLWAGAPGALKRLAGEIATLEDFLNQAVKIACGSRVASVMEGSKPKCMDDIKSAEAFANQLSERLPKVDIVFKDENPDIARNARINWNRDPDEGSEYERVLNLCFRALIAAVGNALQHTKEGGRVDISITTQKVSWIHIKNEMGEQVKIKASTSHHGVLVVVLNPVRDPKDDSQPSVDGSAGVIRSCLRLMDKNTSYPESEPSRDTPGFWTTTFLLPCPATFRDKKDIIWVDLPY
jgi:SAM-dependent methyltransferase